MVDGMSSNEDDGAEENEVLRAAREAKEARERAAAAEEKQAAHKSRIDWKTAAAAGLGSAAVIAALIYARRDKGD